MDAAGQDWPAPYGRGDDRPMFPNGVVLVYVLPTVEPTTGQFLGSLATITSTLVHPESSALQPQPPSIASRSDISCLTALTHHN
jgi:hypothetical protein